MSYNNNESSLLFEKVVNKIRLSYNHSISEEEASEAARNLIGLCRILLEVQEQMNQNPKHE